MWKLNDFETIFTSNDVMGIQDAIGNVFGYRYIAYYKVVNAQFFTRRTTIPHATPNYGPGGYKFEIDYYRQA